VDIGIKVLSIPGQNEKPQTFETVEKIQARADWNALQPQQTETQEIDKGLTELYLRGVSTQLQPGDVILLVGDDRDRFPGSERWDIRVVQTVRTYPSSDPDKSYTRVTWETGLGHDKPTVYPADNPRVYVFRQRAALFGHNAPDYRIMPDSVKRFYDPSFDPANPDRTKTQWPDFALKVTEENEIDLDTTYPKILAGSWVALTRPGYTELYKVLRARAASRTDFTLTAQVTRIKLDATEHLSWFGLRDTVVLAQTDQLKLIEKPIAEPVEGDRIVLGQLATELNPGQTLLVSGKRIRVRLASTAKGLKLVSADGTQSVDLSPGDLLQVMSPPALIKPGVSEPVVLKPDELVQALASTSPQSIQWQLMDRDGFVGSVTVASNLISLQPATKDDPTVSEIAFINNRADAVSSDRDRTTITLHDPLQNSYDRTTVTVNANVARSTHGETISKEVLGSGDGAQANQSFTLKKPPLTYISASTPSGGQSTLTLRVNEVQWKQVSSLYGLDARSQSFIVRIDNDAKASVIFGDGKSGARLPSGSENVVATYRSGIGLDGNVAAGKLTLLQTRPLGIRGVTNPLAASGGAAPEVLDNARRNAPLTVLTLDRIVSLRDYEDFSRAFAGVGKAQAVSLWNGHTHLVHITAATTKGESIDPRSDLYTNLVTAINAARDPIEPVVVSGFTPRTFSLSAGLIIDSRYVVDDVIAQATSALLAAFAFEKRTFGQPVTAAEIVTTIQAVSGVIAVDLDQLTLDPVVQTGGGALTVTTPSSPAQPPAILTANQVQVNLTTGQIQLAELLLINTRGISLKQKEMSS
jgi:hypothetical protein